MTNPHEAALEAALEAANLAAPSSEYGVCDMMIEAAVQSYLTAMREAGFVCVPVDPTQAMISAAETMGEPYCPEITWELMIAAAQEGE